jgi:hypothetical protein
MSIYSRQYRHLPVRPNLDQLKHQARDLLRDLRRGEANAIEEFSTITRARSRRIRPGLPMRNWRSLAVIRPPIGRGWSRLANSSTQFGATT